jgi:cytochrome c biogenesis factor
MNPMLKKVLLFFFGNLFFAALVIVVYAVGFEYDRANKLSPEMKHVSYDVSMQVYGQRWERVAKTLIALGIVIDAAVLLSWYRKRQNSNVKRLDITTTL